MTYKLLLVLHLLGAAIWIGGHAALLAAILPRALRERDAARVLEFERGYGRLGLGALVVQLVTGVWLASFWIGDWRTALDDPTPAAVGAAVKIMLLTITVALAGHAHHRLLPALTPDRLRVFAVHAWVVTVLAVLMLLVGVHIRLSAPA